MVACGEQRVVAEVLQQQRAERDLLHAQEFDQWRIQIPRAARHVEDRVALRAAGARVQCAVERRDAFERLARVRIRAREHHEHLHAAGDVGPHDGVVDVADDAKVRGGRRHEHLRLGAHRVVAVRRGIDQFELHRLPARGVDRSRGVQLHAEVALGIARHLARFAVEQRPHACAGHLVGFELLESANGVAPTRVARARCRDALVFEHAAAELQPLRRAVADVRNDHQRPRRWPALPDVRSRAVGQIVGPRDEPLQDLLPTAHRLNRTARERRARPAA